MHDREQALRLEQARVGDDDQAEANRKRSFWREVHITVNFLGCSIRFYRTASGRSPVREFLDSLSGRQAKKVAWVLRLFEELDRTPPEYFKKLSGTDELWEIRAQQGGDAFRLLGFFDPPRFLVLVSAFAKKTSKTPKQEIEGAEQRRRDYFRRRRDDE